MTIRPDQARELLYGATPGPWEMVYEEWENPEGIPCESWTVCDQNDGLMETADFDSATHDPAANTTLAAAAPDMAETIAGMTELWAVEEMADDGGWWRVTVWHTNRADAESFLQGSDRRLVRRLVSAPEVIDGE